MEDKDHKEQDTTSASEETSQETVTETATETQEQETETASQDIDYKAELERVQNELKQAQHTIVKLKTEKKDDVLEPDIVTDDVPDVRAVVREELRNVQLEAKVDSRASSPEEAALIKFHLQNSIIRTGNDEEDIKRARALANATKVEHTIGELKRIATKPDAKTTSTSGGQKQDVKPAIELTPQEQKLAQRYKLSPEEIAKSRQ